MFEVDKNKCLGCGTCVQVCPGGTKMGDDDKAEIIDQKKLKECGGESVCPFGAIKKVPEKEKKI